ncbi:uncharacterized protein RHOBADRAFT_56375 [Rhodotorula graminis WP1]|uniref:C2H2-type domain-containing protein n=1 Tax=Rhodotorula graminis (strain WP1) TaxID=578459 RepID=A0A0P9EEF1_RHOGW|nr:uncharacterized protein RHOBADRAFT_56375 [Rhodotorula graminis WP1]KPV71754.1 hypothetical protein RHOBADRAFT_56375 [Rhodotorula graminis WP1]
MSTRWSALLSSSRPSTTAIPPSHSRASPPPPQSLPRALHHFSERDHVPGQASADSPGPSSDSPVRSARAALSTQPQLWSASTALPWLETSEDGIEGGTIERAVSMGGAGARRAVRTSYGAASEVSARAGSGYTFEPPLDQHHADDGRSAAQEGVDMRQQEEPAGSDIGGEFTFGFDSPVLVATRAVDEHGYDLASPDSHIAYSPAERLEPVSPISPLSGGVEQGRPLGGSYFPSQADYAVPPPSSLYEGPASAPTYTHDSYYPGAASYPPSFAAAPVPLSMAAYQSFAYAQTSASSEHYVSATAYDDGDDGTSGFHGFAPPPPPSSSSAFHPMQHRRISTGGIFPHFYSPPSHTTSTYRYVRAPSPPRSPASLLAANVPFVGPTSPRSGLKPELDDADLPSPPPPVPDESLYGSPMSASSFGSGGLSAWSFGGSPSGDSGADGQPSSSSASGPASRRISRAPDDLDPDYEPSSPPPSSSLAAHPKLHSSSAARPISPITGKPVKKISKRGWPPKDAHKRVFVCEFEGCTKKFGRPSARDTHMRSHTGVKPFTCPIPTCARSFGVFSNLKRHMIVHPTVDFRQVNVHDLPHMRFVQDRPGSVPTPDGGRLEWIEDEDDEVPQQEGAMQE